jgi:glycosyltransferase involved in cell wall biosynthesis
MAACENPASTVLGPTELGWQELAQPVHDYAFWDWRARAARAEAVATALGAALTDQPADIVVTHDTAVPAVARAAAGAGVPLLVWLFGYETLCHWRFAAGSTCVPDSHCRACPRTLALSPQERAARIAHADGHAAALAGATALVAVSRLLADTAALVCGRTPDVVAPIAAAPPAVRADVHGPVLAVSSLWTQDKGVELLAPIARQLAPNRRLVVQCGDGGQHMPVPAELAALENVEVRTGPAEIGELLDGASVLIVPSQLPDTWVRVAFEGMAAGVPVLGSDTGGMREFVPAAQRVSPHDDPRAWGAALDRLAEPDAWAAARARGLAAAAAVLDARPAERAVALIEAAARSR